ncbi:MAG: PH domain-containing protein [Ruminococcaceae bacterium]|nr:PH domain-containing protein [Oscillospiraceae bacterium]
MKDNGIKLLWKDRKRYMGMPISFTKYSLGEDRLFCETGFFNSQFEEVLLYRVRDISLKRSLWQKIFGVGSVHIVSTDATLPELVLKNVKDSFNVKELIHSQVEKVKIARRVRITEVNDVDDDCDCDCGDELIGD